MIEVKGLDKIQKSLNDLAKNVKRLEDTNSVRFDDMYNSAFMRKNTNFSSISELFENSDFKVNSQKDLENIPDLEWNEYIVSVTKFNSWEDMQKLAGEEYIKKQMGF